MAEVTLASLNKKCPVVIVNYDDGKQLRLDQWGQRAYDALGHLLFKKQHDHMSRFLYKATVKSELAKLNTKQPAKQRAKAHN